MGGYQGRNTIEQLVNEDKVVLDGLLVKLPKVAATELDEPVQELEHESCIRIALSNGDKVDVLVFDMAEGRAAQCQDGGAHLRIADDLDAEDIGKAGAAVIAKGAKNKILAFLVKDEDS